MMLLKLPKRLHQHGHIGGDIKSVIETQNKMHSKRSYDALPLIYNTIQATSYLVQATLTL